MQTTLLIMAAGIGSRFGGGIKQLEPVDETGHIIMDYSIECEPIRVDDYTGKKMTFFHDPDGLPLELHE